MNTARFCRLGAVAGVLLGLAALPSLSRTQAVSLVSPVTVGTKGNEPIVRPAPDGTLYISALQHLYRSTNGGATWTELPGPTLTTGNLNSDSSISVDPGGRLYFSFDYPYAGNTAVCTSDDHGTTFTCDPAVVPGGTDRMWVLAPSTTSAYETTNEGLYETAFLLSTDRGATWVPKQFTTNVLQPQTGPLIQKPGSSLVLQPLNDSNTNQIGLYVWDPTGASVTQTERTTPLPIPNALPTDAVSKDGTIWLASEGPNPAGGREALVAYSSNEGLTWTELPPIPQTTTGAATFTSIAAGSHGHVGVLYYYTHDSVDPTTTTTSTWSAVYVETFNATDPTPTWTTTTVDPGVHTGSVCAAASCMGTARFSGDFITAYIGAGDQSLLTWEREVTQGATTSTEVRFARVASPTAARVSSFTVARLASSLTFTWHLAQSSRVSGFDLYAGLHRLNARHIAVHAGPTYRYHTRWSGPGAFRLHLLLTNGSEIVVPLRPHAGR